MASLPLNRRLSITQKPAASRTVLVYLVVLLAFSWIGYMVFTQTTRSSTNAGSKDSNEDDETSQYGTNAQSSFSELIQLMDLPSNYLPETGKHRRSSRLVIVGDIHGMKDALVHLLNKINFDQKHDHLILAGDMIAKGPDSPGVVDLLMELEASAVRGNHEDRIIHAYTEMLAEHISIDSPSKEEVNPQDIPEEESSTRGDNNDRALVKALGKKRIQWLKERPVILRVGKLGEMGEVVVVHAGLAPGVKLEQQDPAMVMNMRTIAKNGVPSDKREGVPWIMSWNKYQESLHKDSRSTVIYGHDSKRGLQIEKYSMGIDTGCLKGGQLTAVIIEGGHSEHKHSIVHVNCKDERVN